MNAPRTALSARVVARCDADNLAPGHELRELATKFDEAVTTHTGPECNPETAKRMAGAWARLRHRWCEYSGEALL